MYVDEIANKIEKLSDIRKERFDLADKEQDFSKKLVHLQEAKRILNEIYALREIESQKRKKLSPVFMGRN